MVATMTVYRGDDKSWDLTFTDSAGDVIDITDHTIFFTVKHHKIDADADAVISKDISSHTDAAAGESRLTLSNSDTDVAVKVYVFDFQKVDDLGNVVTLGEGDFIVNQDITIRTS